MDGFLADFISMLTVELGRQPTVEEYSQIMTGYAPEQMPVLSGIARGFATFDHWFCDVPTCTYPNRSFFHAGESSGYVVNMSPPGCFPKTNKAETLFDRLDAAGLTWKVYCDPPSHYSLTGVIHAPRLADKFATNFFSTRQFFADAENGELPTYSFIEPQIIGWNHNDMHPPFGSVLQVAAAAKGADASDFHFDPPSSLIAGEDLLARIYNAIRNSSAPSGSNHLNTTLLVTFDEHGGTYDHVPPPVAVPPDGKGAAGQMGFTFDRSGVRIPTLAISAWIPERTVVNEEHRATSLIATMRERWNLGEPLTGEMQARGASPGSAHSPSRERRRTGRRSFPDPSLRCPRRSYRSTLPWACSGDPSCSPSSRWPKTAARPFPTSSRTTRSPAPRRSPSPTRYWATTSQTCVTETCFHHWQGRRVAGLRRRCPAASAAADGHRRQRPRHR